MRVKNAQLSMLANKGMSPPWQVLCQAAGRIAEPDVLLDISDVLPIPLTQFLRDAFLLLLITYFVMITIPLQVCPTALSC